MIRATCLFAAGAAAILAGSPALAAPTAAGNKPAARHFEFTYHAEVTGIPAGTKSVDVWLPYPPATEDQTIDHVRIDAPVPTRVTREKEYGNSMVYVHVENPAMTSLPITMTFQVTRRERLRQDRLAASAGGGDARNAAADPLVPRFLQGDRLVPIDARITSMADSVAAGKTTPVDKARAIYDFEEATMTYDKTGTGWGHGDIYYACDAKHGNCTDFHAVFTGFCRAEGVPSRFEIGFPIPPDRGEGDVAGYHCWAQFYLKGHGWVPVDASEGSKHADKRDYFFGDLDENRVQFSLGRDITLSPAQKGEKLNYFVYPYVEVDGKPYDGVTKSFHYRDLP